jgi:hypothetical protein
MEETTYIYVLKDPFTDEVRYVGKSNNPHKRVIKHNWVGNKRDKNWRKKEWIKSLLDRGSKPIVEVIDEVSKSEWTIHEKEYIKKYLNEGCDLTNYGEGGEGATYGNQTSFKKGHGARKIVAIDMDGNIFQRFDSIKDGVSFFNKKSTSSIWCTVKKEIRRAYGYNFLYEEEYNNMNKKEFDKHMEWVNTHRYCKNDASFKKGDKTWEGAVKNLQAMPRKKVYQHTLDGVFIKEWEWAKEAADELGFNDLCIKQKCNNYRGNHKYNGFLWFFDNQD